MIRNPCILFFVSACATGSETRPSGDGDPAGITGGGRQESDGEGEGGGEVCDNALDDDGDGRTDGSDLDCPLLGEVGYDAFDFRIPLDHRIGTGTHRWPVDGRDVLMKTDRRTLAWRDLATLTGGDGPGSVLAELPITEPDFAEIPTMVDLSDVEGDGWSDFVIQVGYEESEPRIARFAVVPGAVAVDEAALVSSTGILMGVAPGAGDASQERILAWYRGARDGFKGVGWLDASLTGEVDSRTECASILELTGSEEDTHSFPGSFSVGRMDADGDGVDESAISVPYQENYGDVWQTGYVWLMPARPTDGSTLVDEAIAMVHDPTTLLESAAAVSDLDGDGYEDLVASFAPEEGLYDREVVVYTGPLSGAFDQAAAAHSVAEGWLASSFYSIDLDGDGFQSELVLHAQAPSDDVPGWYGYLDPMDATSLGDADLHIAAPPIPRPGSGSTAYST